MMQQKSICVNEKRNGAKTQYFKLNLVCNKA